MPISRRGKIIKLAGVIGVEDAEIIYAQFEQQLFNKVDLSACQHLHSAVLQLIVVFQIPIHKYPPQADFAAWFSQSESLYPCRQEA